MSTKRDELTNPRSCLSKARPDEPLFVLRANDRTAAQVVRLWIAMNDGIRSPEKCAEALHCADVMEKWNAQNVPQAAETPRDVIHAAVSAKSNPFPYRP